MINGNNNGDNNYTSLLPVVDDSPPSGGLAELDPVLITNLVRVLWLLLDRTVKKKKKRFNWKHIVVDRYK